MTRSRFVSYLRVSTQGQGRSGLGLEAQREAVKAHLSGGAWTLAAEFVEVESGKRNDRPQLAAALAHARAIGATLVIAKLDRLARNARFLLGIVESGADVVFCDLPTIPAGPIGKFMVTQMAAVAELEAGLISARTKAALAAAKARGVRLGRPENLSNRAEGQVRGRIRQGARAKARADDLSAVIADVQASGATSLRAIAAALNERGIPAPRGGAWTGWQVRRVVGSSPAPISVRHHSDASPMADGYPLDLSSVSVGTPQNAQLVSL